MNPWLLWAALMSMAMGRPGTALGCLWLGLLIGSSKDPKR